MSSADYEVYTTKNGKHNKLGSLQPNTKLVVNSSNATVFVYNNGRLTSTKTGSIYSVDKKGQIFENNQVVGYISNYEEYVRVYEKGKAPNNASSKDKKAKSANSSNSPKIKCRYRHAKDIKVSNSKVSGAVNGTIQFDSDSIKLTRTHSFLIPIIVSAVIALFSFGSAANAAAGLGSALGAGAAGFLITTAIVFIIDNSYSVTVSRQQVTNVYNEIEPQRIVLNLSTGKKLAVTGDGELLSRISSWAR